MTPGNIYRRDNGDRAILIIGLSGALHLMPVHGDQVEIDFGAEPMQENELSKWTLESTAKQREEANGQ